MRYHRLTQTERYQIEGYLKSGLGSTEIATLMQRDRTTIWRELQKCKGQYTGAEAQKMTIKRREGRYRTRKRMQGPVKNYVLSKLNEQWSPEQIAGRMRRDKYGKISHQTIYSYLREDKNEGGKLFKNLRLLRIQRKDRKSPKWKPSAPICRDRKMITERPKIVDKRSRLGDLERDTVHGKAYSSMMLTVVDRRSRLLRLEFLEKKCSKLVHEATLKCLRGSPCHTITNDNGTEFAYHQETAKALGAQVYFAQSYRSCQRGTNENINGLVRQYFPKRHAITKEMRPQIKEVERKLNNRPRKSLNYMTPLEVHQRLNV